MPDRSSSDETRQVRTFLIADVRGYTRFTRERGDAAAALLATKFADLARDAVEARSGRVIELRGDEALAAFDSPAEAVRAAVEFQAACLEESRTDPEFPLPVGIGIDVGEAIPVEDGYRGVPLNMAARLCSSAAAGEVLVTRAVAEQALALDGHVRFEERGPASFKGFEQPVDVIEVVADGALAFEPVPEELAATLPPELDPLTPLVGREHELRWLRGTWRQVRRGRGRVLFVSGPAQIGKTRLGAEIARFVNDQGGSLRYAGPGGAGTALALATLRDALQAPTPTFVVLDDADVAGPALAEAIGASLDEVASKPLLILALLRDPATDPEFAAILEKVDQEGDGHRALTALDLEGVRGIVEVYVGAEADTVPVEAMARASGGIPGRVHEVVSDWARSEAARRLEAAAEFLASNRERHAGDLEFANNVIGLQLGRLFTVEGRDVLAVDTCPYKGLASFVGDDAAYFFGRERLVGELAARTVQVGLLGVVGASGSGKSSVVAAGLLPSLRAGLLPGSQHWTEATLRPGEHPMDELRRTLRQDGDDPLEAALGETSGRLVLVIDQFEETFTICSSEEERATFIDTLMRAARGDPERIAIVLTIRGDYYAHCAPYPELAEALAANHVLVGPLVREELRRVVELPARRAGLRVEAALVDALVEEVADEPGALPLLSTALVELWQAREGGWIRMEAYERSGGLRGAVARLAEGSYAELSDVEREAARLVFIRLVAVGEGDATTKRRVDLDEFDLETDPVAATVIKILTQDRLLTMGEHTVEVAHEALLREWPRLQGWLEQDTQGRQLRQHLTQAARQWQSRGREPSELYRGARLSTALDWSAEHSAELNELEREFLAASGSAAQQEAERQRRTNRRLRALLAGTALFLVVALAAGALAFVQRDRARHSATVALAKSLGAQAVIEPNLDTAMLLAAESVTLDASEQTRNTMLSTLLRSPTAIRALYADRGVVSGSGETVPRAISLSPDGGVLAISLNIGKVVFVDTRTGGVIFRPIENAADCMDSAAAVLDPGGRLATRRDCGNRTIEVIDPRSGDVVRSLRLPLGMPDDLLWLHTAFSGDGRMMATEFVSGDPAAGVFVVQWDTQTRERVGTVIRLPEEVAGGLAYVANATRLTAFGTKTWVLNPRTAAVIRTFPVGGNTGAVSPDGRTIAVGSGDGSVRFLDVSTGQVTEGIGGHTAAVESLAFSRDGRTVISTGDDHGVLLWDLPSAKVKETLAGHAEAVGTQAITRDGSTLYTGSNDGSVLVWDLAGDRGFERRLGATSGNLGEVDPTAQGPPTFVSPTIAPSPDGKLVATGDDKGRIHLWDVASLREVDSWTAIDGGIAKLQFASDGRSLLVLAGTGTSFTELRLVAARGDHRVLQDLSSNVAISDAALSPDGTRVAATFADADAGWAVWAVATGTRLFGRTVKTPVRAVTYGPDGSWFAAVVEKATSSGPPIEAVDIVDAQTGAVQRQFDVGDVTPVPPAIAVSADGRTLATGLWQQAHLWDATSGEAIGGNFKASEAGVRSVAFNPEGTTLAVGGTDGATRLFEVATQHQIGPAISGADNRWEVAQFTADGSRIVVSYDTGEGFVWPASVEGWRAHACAFAHRNLRAGEWARFAPDRRRESICRQFPLR